MKKVLFKKANFLGDALEKEEIPSLKESRGRYLPEVAIVGRSNVGKSSLLNHLLQNKKLAKVSSTPGKTKKIHFFLVDDLFCLVDLPGYGFSKVAQCLKDRWSSLIEFYFNNRENLKLLIQLIDIRRMPTQEDMDMFLWAQTRHLPVLLVFTKADKLNSSQVDIQVKKIEEIFSQEKKCPYVIYSIFQMKSREIFIHQINDLLKEI